MLCGLRYFVYVKVNVNIFVLWDVTPFSLVLGFDVSEESPVCSR